MLTHIHILNFAIIEELDLELLPGMTALTGETGAGKSILLDAIGLVLGDRTDSSIVRHGTDKTSITLTVDISNTPSAKQWLIEQELDEDDTCILRRVISSAGKSRSWINGSPCNLTMLRQLGEQLVDIHGQHEHQSLMKKDAQRTLLDDFANKPKLLRETATAFRHWKKLKDRYEELAQTNSTHLERIDLLKFQLDELETLQLQENEVATLDDEHKRLANAGELIQTCEQTSQQLYENDASIYSQLNHLTHLLNQQLSNDTALQEPYELLEQAQIQIQEAASQLRHHVDRLDLDPSRLEWVENRLSDIQTLARKHRIDPEELPEKQQRISDELAELDSDDFDLDALKSKLDKAETDYLQAAQQLTGQRQKSAQQLSTDVSKAMQTLGMQGGTFNIALIPQEKYTQQGLEQIEFQVSANPGQPLKPLTKVASGGELSRISLAIQMIAAQKVSLPALIFDEVDTGIGGGIAEIVGKQLRQLGETKDDIQRQVLCVTHLPQVASQAHQHYKVTKQKTAEQTTTGMLHLSHQERIEEIARMMGGIDITEATLKLAEEMVNI
jgi:DNA repair protein RecN (Recombination protein N)